VPLVSSQHLEAASTSSGVVANPMTGRAEGDQIGFGVISQTTPGPYVVDLEVDKRTALLASPTIAL
jgi:hypothetical protein